MRSLVVKARMSVHTGGRPGLDVVDSPAELQAEVPGRPPKTTGTQRKCERKPRTRRLTELGDASLRAGPVARVAASRTGWRRRRANRRRRETEGWLARR